MSGEVRFAALGCGFRVSTDIPDVAEYVRWLVRHLPDGEATTVRDYRVRRAPNGTLEVLAEGEPLPASASLPPLAALLRDIDEHIIATTPRLLIHSAAAVHDGLGVALPGRSGTGKSTLVAALVKAGLGYLTDEFVSPDWRTGEVSPYPRTMSLYEDSWKLLPELEPDVDVGLRSALAGQWQVDPEQIRPGSVAGPCSLGYVVFPTYEPGQRTSFERMARADAVLALVECTFHFHRHGARALETIANVIADCECFRLVMGDLAEGCDALLAELGVTRPVTT